MTTRPTTLKILNLDWKVQWVPSETDSGTSKFGWTSIVQQAIFVHEMSNLRKMADTFLHELLHAVCWTMGLGDGMKEEDMCNSMGTGLCTVWRDNPQVFQWLAEQICEAPTENGPLSFKALVGAVAHLRKEKA